MQAQDFLTIIYHRPTDYSVNCRRLYCEEQGRLLKKSVIEVEEFYLKNILWFEWVHLFVPSQPLYHAQNMHAVGKKTICDPTFKGAYY